MILQILDLITFSILRSRLDLILDLYIFFLKKANTSQSGCSLFYMRFMRHTRKVSRSFPQLFDFLTRELDLNYIFIYYYYSVYFSKSF